MNRSQYYIMQKKHEDYLMHHGIDGQKWGVKHGPPYPLDDSKSTGSRLKTKKKKKLSPTREKNIKKGALIGAIVGGPVGAIIGGSIAAKKTSNSKSDNKKVTKPKKKTASEKYMERHKDEYEAQRKEREEKYRKAMDQYKDPEFRKKKYADAKNDDMFDFDFLENWHLNSYYHDETKDPSKEETLREYKRYLQDPEKWIREGHSGSR